MNRIDAIKKKINNKEPVIGAVVSLTDSSVSERLGYVGYDFLWVDAEHNGIDYNQIMLHIIAASSGQTASLVRIRNNDPAIVKPILDMGPDGVIFPQIKTVEDAKLAVSSCLYPPDGIRGFGPGRAIRYGMDSGSEYLQRSREKTWIILQVEHIECVLNLEMILNIDCIDALMIGPSDLACSLGFAGQSNHIEVQKTIDRICEIANRHNMPIGAFTGSDPEMIKKYLQRGISLFAIGSDGGFMMNDAKASLLSVKTICCQH
jgi:2-dehydro-3-deoxyglucarate aldolase/4-hydroxy-2-oxoheptanedioate aldolase